MGVVVEVVVVVVEVVVVVVVVFGGALRRIANSCLHGCGLLRRKR